ncbi:MAG: methyltransferase [Anaerolineae bacterium]|jgi:16S rRNA G1207 methylase RsmC|nr:methyltransferase [Anaerolineae bacterium]
MHDDTLKAYLKKTVELSIAGQHLEFAVSQTLFSSHQIDIGSSHLLKTLQPQQIKDDAKILDLGCGYGPLGLTLARLKGGAQVHLVDRDALAVEFAQANAGRLGLANVRTYGSLGYDDVVSHDFDLIVSNIPGKAGAPVIQALLLDARSRLAEGGRIAVVVVLPLEQMVNDLLTDPEIEIALHQTTAAHAVFHYRFATTVPGGTGAHDAAWSGFEHGIYDRGESIFPLEGPALPLRTAFGLPEFDTLSFETELLLKAFQDLGNANPRRAVVFNPRQGHVAVALWRYLKPDAIDLVDRDLLSLRYARANLIRGGCPEASIGLYHQTSLVPAHSSPDLIVGLLREEEGPDAIEATLLEASKQLAPGGQILIAGGSTPITRVLMSGTVERYLRAGKRRRHKGNSTALLQHRFP